MQVALAADTISAVAHETRGCLLCRAAASSIGMHAPGLDHAGIVAVTQALAGLLENGSPLPASLAAHWPELAMFEPARAHPSRHKCVLLPFQALREALEKSTAAGASGTPVAGAR